MNDREARIEEIARDAWDHVPSRPPNEGYYDRPVLKEPVWRWYIPAYLYAGGAAGAAAALGAAAQALGGESMRGLVRSSRRIAAAGTAAGSVLLVADLGKPERFLNMIRVFRPTSPMSVGSFVLASAAPAAIASAALADSPAALGALGDAAGLGAGALGLPLAGYTAVLVSNSAVPVWSEMRTSLPALFVASAAASAASLLDFTSLNETEARAVHRFGITAKLGELAAMREVERDVHRVERVGRPLREGLSGSLWKVAKSATAASLAVSLLPGKARWKRSLAGALGTAGAVALRFAVVRAGFVSARDPRATFDVQRANTP